MTNKNYSNNIFLGIWLLILTLMVYLIILIGGLTRLTESGLSIVDWKPLLGAIPPISNEDWYNLFNKYKQTPEYNIVNQNIDLEGFRYIFWWEYIHRLFARLIGIVFFNSIYIFSYKKVPIKKINYKINYCFYFFITSGNSWLVDGKKRIKQ